MSVYHSILNVKALEGALSQEMLEMALVGAFSVITKHFVDLRLKI